MKYNVTVRMKKCMEKDMNEGLADRKHGIPHNIFYLHTRICILYTKQYKIVCHSNISEIKENSSCP